NDQASPGVRWLKVDARGKPMGAIHSVDVQATSLSGLALECTQQSCHLVFGGANNDQAMLWAARFAPESGSGEQAAKPPAEQAAKQNIVASALTTLSGSPTQQLMLTL